MSSLTASAFLFALSWHAGLVFTTLPLQRWDCETCRFEFEDKKEYLNELSKQQFDLAASTHYTTGRSQVRLTACLPAMSDTVIAELLHVAGEALLTVAFVTAYMQHTAGESLLNMGSMIAEMQHKASRSHLTSSPVLEKKYMLVS